MKYNILDDLSTLSRIKPAIFTKLLRVGEYAICDYLDSLKLVDEDILEIDLGLGTLTLCVGDGEIDYQFKPTPRLEKNIVRTLLDGENSLTLNVEAGLERKIESTYKDLF